MDWMLYSTLYIKWNTKSYRSILGHSLYCICYQHLFAPINRTGHDCMSWEGLCWQPLVDWVEKYVFIRTFGTGQTYICTHIYKCWWSPSSLITGILGEPLFLPCLLPSTPSLPHLSLFPSLSQHPTTTGCFNIMNIQTVFSFFPYAVCHIW